MANSGKTLTVSYGTFSCTLEGFDDAFGTMKAIAEYFRDLSANDRYFGAVPPTPDTAVLQQIAEREMLRAVEAHVSDRGVVLRPSKRRNSKSDSQVKEDFDKPAQPLGAARHEQPIEEESVAARLARLRSLVAKNRQQDHERTPSIFAEEEPDDLPALEHTAASDTVGQQNAEPTPAEDPTADDDPREDSDGSSMSDQRVKTAAAQSADAPSPAQDVISDPSDGTASSHGGSVAPWDEVDDDAEDASEPDTSVADNDTPQENGTDEPPKRPVMQAPSGFGQGRVAEHASAQGTGTVTPAEEASQQEPPATPRKLSLGARLLSAQHGRNPTGHAEAHVAQTQNVSVEAQLRAFLGQSGGETDSAVAEEPQENAEVASDGEAPPAEPEVTSAVRPSRPSLASSRPTTERPKPEERAEDEPTDAPEADDTSEQPDAEEKHKARAGRALLETGESGPDGKEMDRLVESANSRFEVAENKRRLSAISHLKAAVAATVAERRYGRDGEMDDHEGGDDLNRYRDDLSRVVNSRELTLPGGQPRPEESSEEPFVLENASESSVTPRRVAPEDELFGLLGMEEEDDDSPTLSFADFAESSGAADLPELLEAAAAYLAVHEGRPHFSRPQIMRKVALVAAKDGFSREEGLRSFGTLLRQGRLQKVRRGQFTISQDSRFTEHAREAAR